MTREEAIAVLAESKRQNEVMRDNPSTFWASHQMADGVKNAKRRIEALDVALSALRPVSREQVERMRAKWITIHDTSDRDWSKCGSCQAELDGLEDAYNFCPSCGAPMTGEAVQMVMERLPANKKSSAN